MTLSTAPLYLPRASAEALAFFNALSTRLAPAASPAAGAALPLGKAGQALAVKLAADAPVFAGNPAAVLDLSINGAPWRVLFETLEILRAHPIFREPEFAAYRLEDLPQPLLAAAAMALAKPAADAVSKVLGIPVACTGFAAGAAVPADFGSPVGGFALELPGAALGGAAVLRLHAGVLPLEADGLKALLVAVGKLARTRRGAFAGALARTPFEIGFIVGRTALSTEDFSGLGTGDIVLLPEWLPNASRIDIEVRSGGRFLARYAAKYESGRAEVLDLPYSEQQEPDMQNPEQLPVKLTFELESREMALGDLIGLEPGYAFKLAVDPAEPVTILANGRPIARGRLVDVGGSIGVQLTGPVALEAAGAGTAGAAK